VFWQMEDLSGLAYATKFLSGNGVIRGKDSWEFKPTCEVYSPGNCQEDRVLAGFQFVQTDYPWYVFNNTAWDTLGLPTDPSQRFKDPASVFPNASGNIAPSATFNEPGSRIYFETTPDYPGAWVFADVPTTSHRWLEATVSSTRHGDTWAKNTHDGLIVDDFLNTCPGIADAQADGHCSNYPRAAQEGGEGCIKVSSNSGDEALEVCRQKNTTPGASFSQESVDLYVRVFSGGKLIRNQQWRAPRYAPCKASIDPNSADVSDICVGSIIALAVQNNGDSSVVAVYSAGKLAPSSSLPWLPEWHTLGTATFPSPMTKQGYRGWKSELLVGLRTADQLNAVGMNDWRPEFSRLHQVSLADLPNRDLANKNSRIVDLPFHAR
jgi:hypothetical protein